MGTYVTAFNDFIQVKVFIQFKGERFLPSKLNGEDLLKRVKEELSVGEIGLELASEGSDVWHDVKNSVTLKTADTLRIKQVVSLSLTLSL